jgi:hypothetical protein
MNFAAKAEQRRGQIAQEPIDQGRVAIEEFLHLLAQEVRGGNGLEELK